VDDARRCSQQHNSAKNAQQLPCFSYRSGIVRA
jgi:hypothetical protein